MKNKLNVDYGEICWKIPHFPAYCKYQYSVNEYHCTDPGMDRAVFHCPHPLINLIMDTLAAMAFGGEPILDRYMKDQPAKRTDNILTPYIKSAIGVSAIFITLGSILILENIGGITSWVIPAGCADPELYEKTFMFAFFIYAIIFNSLNTRSEKFNLFEHIGENKNRRTGNGAIFVLQTIIIERFCLSQFQTVSNFVLIIPVILSEKQS